RETLASRPPTSAGLAHADGCRRACGGDGASHGVAVLRTGVPRRGRSCGRGPTPARASRARSAATSTFRASGAAPRPSRTAAYDPAPMSYAMGCRGGARATRPLVFTVLLGVLAASAVAQPGARLSDIPALARARNERQRPRIEAALAPYAA